MATLAEINSRLAFAESQAEKRHLQMMHVYECIISIGKQQKEKTEEQVEETKKESVSVEGDGILKSLAVLNKNIADFHKTDIEKQDTIIGLLTQISTGMIRQEKEDQWDKREDDLESMYKARNEKSSERKKDRMEQSWTKRLLSRFNNDDNDGLIVAGIAGLVAAAKAIAATLALMGAGGVASWLISRNSGVQEVLNEVNPQNQTKDYKVLPDAMRSGVLLKQGAGVASKAGVLSAIPAVATGVSSAVANTDLLKGFQGRVSTIIEGMQSNKTVSAITGKLDDIAKIVSATGFNAAAAEKLKSLTSSLGKYTHGIGVVLKKALMPIAIGFAVFDGFKQTAEYDTAAGKFVGFVEGFANSMVSEPLNLVKNAMTWGIREAFGIEMDEDGNYDTSRMHGRLMQKMQDFNFANITEYWANNFLETFDYLMTSDDGWLVKIPTATHRLTTKPIIDAVTSMTSGMVDILFNVEKDSAGKYSEDSVLGRMMNLFRQQTDIDYKDMSWNLYWEDTGQWYKNTWDNFKAEIDYTINGVELDNSGLAGFGRWILG